MKTTCSLFIITLLTLTVYSVTWASGVSVTLTNEFTSGSYTACFDAKGEMFGIHCAKPGESITHHYRWSPKELKLQIRSGHLTNDLEKSFLTAECLTYFPDDISYIDAWPKYSNYYETNAPQVTIRIWPGPYVIRHYGGYRYTATTWNCSWHGVVGGEKVTDDHE